MKKFKFALLAFLLIPCLLLTTACTKGISANEYSNKIKESAVNYYSNYDGKNSLTIQSTAESSNSWKEVVSYGEDDENSEQVNFKEDSNTTQKIELNIAKVDEEATVKSLRITETETSTLTGKEETEEQTGLVEFTMVEESEKVTIIVQEENEYKAYITTTYSEMGEEPEVENEYYIFGDNEYEEFINDLFDQIDLVVEVFYTPIISIADYIIDIKYESKGKGAFGSQIELEASGVVDKTIIDVSASFENEFKNNLPSKYSLNANIATTNDYLLIESSINPIVELSLTTNIEYSCGAITAPSAFDDASETSMPYVEVLGGLSFDL